MKRFLASERGEAPLEFVALTALLVLPLIYLLFSLGNVQAASLATEQSAQIAATLYSRGMSEDAVHQQVRLIFADFGVKQPPTVTKSCGRCRKNDPLTVTVDTTATLPGMDYLLSNTPVGISVSSQFRTVIYKEAAN